MWRSHASFAKRASLGEAVIICRRQTSFKKGTFVYQTKVPFLLVRVTGVELCNTHAARAQERFSQAERLRFAPQIPLPLRI